MKDKALGNRIRKHENSPSATETWFIQTCKQTKKNNPKTYRGLTQFQGRSRIPEGTSQRLGGCRGLAKHNRELQTGTNNNAKKFYVGGRTRVTIHRVKHRYDPGDRTRGTRLSRIDTPKACVCLDNPVQKSGIESTWNVRARHLQHGPGRSADEWMRKWDTLL